MKNWIVIICLSLSLLGCLSEVGVSTGITMTRLEVESLVDRDIILYEKSLELSGRVPPTYESHYKKPHLVRLYEASTFFREKVENLESLHENQVIHLDRKILDAKKAEIDSGVKLNSSKSEKLRLLKREKSSLQSEHNNAIKILKEKEKQRINHLNEQYLSVLKADFPS